VNVLFLTPYITDFTAYDLWLRPLGLLYLASIVENHTDCRVLWLNPLDRFSGPGPFPPPGNSDGRGPFPRIIIESPQPFQSIPRTFARYGWPLESFNAKLDALPEVDIIFMTTLMTYWIDGAVYTLNLLRKRYPDAYAVVGGILPTLMPDSCRREIPAHEYISGHGESRILELIVRKGGRIRGETDFSDPDKLPYPADHFIGAGAPLPLMTSRGCPMNCTYCASSILHPTFRERRAGSVISELRSRIAESGTRTFVLFDDALLINAEKRFLPIARAAAEMELCLHTPNGLHVSRINKETARALRFSGTRTLRLSLETTDPAIMARSSEKTNTRAMEHAVDHLLAAGYTHKDIEVYLLWGVPDQPLSSVHRAIDFVEKLGVVPRLADYSPVPGTRDFRGLAVSGVLGDPIDPRLTNKLFHMFRNSGYEEADIRATRTRCREIIQAIKTKS